MLGKNIKYLRSANNLTQDNLCEEINKIFPGAKFYKGRLSKWERSIEEPKLSSVKMLADYFEVSVDDLANKDLSLTSEENIETDNLLSIYNKLENPRKEKVYSFAEEQLEEQTYTVNENVVEFPYKTELPETELQGIPVSAGDGEWLEGLEKETIYYKGIVPKHDFVAIVNGKSMEPTFEDNEILFVKKSHEARKGQFVVARINGMAFLKKFVIESGKPKLLSLNKEYDDIEIGEQDRFEIIGIVNL